MNKLTLKNCPEELGKLSRQLCDATQHELFDKCLNPVIMDYSRKGAGYRYNMAMKIKGERNHKVFLEWVGKLKKCLKVHRDLELDLITEWWTDKLGRVTIDDKEVEMTRYLLARTPIKKITNDWAF